jgi:hypothetical protein
MWAALCESFAAEAFVPRPVDASHCGRPGKGSAWATGRSREPCLRPGKSVRSRSRARRQLAASLTAAPVGGFAIVLQQARDASTRRCQWVSGSGKTGPLVDSPKIPCREECFISPCCQRWRQKRAAKPWFGVRLRPSRFNPASAARSRDRVDSLEKACRWRARHGRGISRRPARHGS